jgi:hypothetical protein
MEDCDVTASPNDESPSENGDSEVDPNYSLTFMYYASSILGQVFHYLIFA